MHKHFQAYMSRNVKYRWSRREFLGATTVAMASTPFLCAGRFTPPANFTRRTLNGWITDLATEPDPNTAWPSMRLDERLLEDYGQTFALMRRVGFNEIVIWGLYTANNWPVDLTMAVPLERGRRVEQLIASAHEHGINVLSGLGTYSWGFAEIIKAHPKLYGGNANAMCASEPESHVWMQRVLDYIFTRFPIDGVSMQSADQGRCKCSRCAKLGDLDYHAQLLARTAEAIRARWPNKILGMSNWGVSFGQRGDKETLANLSRSLDYMIDHNDSARWGGPGYRKELITALHCAIGTTGGPVVEPPQHWSRDRWFLPTCQAVHRHLQALHADGGRACEFFYHILANPSSELTWHVAGRMLANPQAPLEKHLHEVLEELYQPRDIATRNALARFFLEAEDAYLRYLPKDECGTISLEPLVGSKPGPPVYLRSEQRAAYAVDLERLSNEFARLQPSLRAKVRSGRVRDCLAAVRKDLN